MKIITSFSVFCIALIVVCRPFFGHSQRLILYQFGSSSTSVGQLTPRGYSPSGVTEGYFPPQMLFRPQFSDTFSQAHPPLFLPLFLNNNYASFTWETPQALTEGFYPYFFNSIYHPNKVIRDSVFVRFLDNFRAPRITNLVIVDAHNLSYFKVLDIISGTQVSLCLYNLSGRLLYSNKHYQNTYDMRDLSAGTYLYVVKMSYLGRERLDKGFVELIKK